MDTDVTTTATGTGAPTTGGDVSSSPTSTPSTGVDTSVSTDGGGGSGDGKIAAEAVPSYAPNFKFKAYDKEHEIDEVFRSLIKDKETEDKIRQFHERAFGFDGLKGMHGELKDQYKTVSEKYNSIDSNLKQLGEFVKANDLGSFFETLNIPKEMVFQFVKSELEKMGAPPDQRAQIEEFQRIRRENLQLKRQNEFAMSQAEAQTLQTRTVELDTALSRPDVSSLSSLVDAKRGSGAFKRSVIERGVLAYQMTGQEIPVGQAIEEAIAMWSPFMQAQAQPGLAAPMAPDATPEQAATKPSLPNVGGRSTSPIKKGVRSLDDLKKIAAAQ